MFFLLLWYLSPLYLISIPIHLAIILYRYLAARRQNKLVGGEYWRQELSNRKRTLIVTSIVHVAIAGILFGLVAIVANAIAYM